MRVLPQTPLDWVLLVVAAATGVIIAVALQDFFIDSRVNNPRIRALQDVGVGFAVIHFFGLLMLGSASPRWAAAAIAMYVVATLLFLSALESARRVQLPRTLVDEHHAEGVDHHRAVRAGPPSVLHRLLAGLAGGAGRHARPVDHADRACSPWQSTWSPRAAKSASSRRSSATPIARTARSRVDRAVASRRRPLVPLTASRATAADPHPLVAGGIGGGRRHLLRRRPHDLLRDVASAAAGGCG